MSAERVAMAPTCEVCGDVRLPADEERWRAIWIDDGREERLLFYCRECAEREFDE